MLFRMLTLLALLAFRGEMAVAQQRLPTPVGGSFADDFSFFNRGQWFLSNGWVGGDHSDCMLSAGNVVSRPGSVELVLKKEPNKLRQFTCGDLQSQRLYGYGTYEVRLRPAEGSGILTTFFIYSNSDGKTDEIDFMFLGRDLARAQLNYTAAGKRSQGITVDLASDATKANYYALEWLPDSIRWFAGGKLVHEVRRSPETPLPSRPGKLFVSVWNGRGANMAQWLGDFTDQGKPVSAVIDYVSYTKMGEPCQFQKSVACQSGANGRPAR